MIGNTYSLLTFVIHIINTRATDPGVPSWLELCRTNGLVQCNDLKFPGDAATSDISRVNITIENCSLTDCPLISISSGAFVNFRNVSFLRSRNQNPNVKGGAISIDSSIVSFENTLFQDSYSATLGGALYILSSTVTLSRCSFVRGVSASTNGGSGGGAIASDLSTVIGTDLIFDQNVAAYDGGSVKLSQSSVFSCTNCSFTNSLAKRNGGSLAIYQASVFNWTGGICKNSTSASWGGCLVLDRNGLMNIDNVRTLDTVTANTGGAFYVDNNSTASFSNVTSTNATALLGGALYLYLNSTALLNNSRISRSTARSHGGAVYVQNQSQLYLVNTTIEQSQSGDHGGAIHGLESASIILSNSRIIEGSAWYGGLVSIAGTGSMLRCGDGSVMQDGLAKIGGGAIYSAEGGTSTLILAECRIRNNSAVHDGGGIWIGGTTKLLLGNMSRIVNNTARRGGGIFTADASLVLFGDDATLKGNTAGTCGGGLASDDSTPTVVVSSPTLEMTENVAPVGDLFCLNGRNGSNFIFNASKTVDKKSVSGSIWIDDTRTALEYLKRKLPQNFPGATFEGKASQLEVTAGPDQMNITLNVRQTLPLLTVTAKDVFGRASLVVQSSPVVVQLSEITNAHALIMGEYTKAILDQQSDSVNFTNLMISATPGHYVIQIGAVVGTVSHIDELGWPLLMVTVSECKPQTERFVESKGLCLPTRSTGTVTRVVTGIIAAPFAIITTVIIILLFRNRRVRLIKRNSYVFLCLACLGSTLGLLTPVLSIITAPVICLVTLWLDHIGLAMIFAAIIVKTFRIFKIFGMNVNESMGKKLRDSRLLPYFFVACGVVVAYLTTWTSLNPAYPAEVVVYESFVSLDRCASSSFSVGACLIRVLIQIVAVWLAFSIRNVPSDFNESRFILFATYNWVIFGGLIEAVTTFAINDPEIAFILHSISIIVPNVICVGLLGGYKIYMCIKHPEEVNKNTTGVEMVAHVSKAFARRQSETTTKT